MPYWRSIDAPVPVQPITPLRFEDVRHVAAFLEPGLAISILKYSPLVSVHRENLII